LSSGPVQSGAAEDGDVNDELATRQLRLDAIAADVFEAAGWTGPRPPVTVDPTLSRYTRARCMIRPGRERIRIHPRVLDEPEPVQRGTVAHEIAHLLEGQARGWPVALIVTVALWAAAITLVWRAMMQDDAAALAGRFGAGLVFACLAWGVAVTPQRHCELRADQRSVALVGRQAVLQTLRQLREDTPAVLRALAAAGLETHPSPTQRLRHLSAAAD